MIAFFERLAERFANGSSRAAAPAEQPVRFHNELTDGNVFVDEGAQLLEGKFSSKSGTGNEIRIGKNTRFKGTIGFRGNNNRVVFGENCDYRGDILVKGDNQTVSIGDRSTTVDVYILCQEGCDVTIGKSCMFSREIEIRTTDAHSVIDRKSGLRINKPASIRVGDHVWVGVGAIINKGASIPADCIVGAMSFVNGRFEEEGTVIAGAPAKVVKRGITWNRSRKTRFTEAQMDEWRDPAHET